jgi:hypothetical protein
LLGRGWLGKWFVVGIADHRRAKVLCTQY